MSFGNDSFSDQAGRKPTKGVPPNPYAAPQAIEEEGVRVPTPAGEMDLNPWLSIWTKPRATIRQLINTNGAQQAPLVVALAGAANGLSNAQSAVAGAGFAGAIVGGAIAGVVIGFLVWLLFSWLIKITGVWIGGSATLSEMRTAYAWAQVPSIWAAPLSIALLIAGGGNPDQALGGNPQLAIVFRAVGSTMIVIGVWSLVVMCKAVGEAHLFSAWHGLGAIILAGLVFTGAMMAIFVPIMVLVVANS